MASKSTLIASLEFQSNQAFTALRQAVTKENGTDRCWAERLYKIYLENLRSATRYYDGYSGGTTDFQNYTRTPHRANLYDRYILQYLTGSACSRALGQIESCRNVPRIITERKEQIGDISTKVDHLFQALQQRDLSYCDIHILLYELQSGSYVKPLWKATQFVRSQYPPPKTL